MCPKTQSKAEILWLAPILFFLSLKLSLTKTNIDFSSKQDFVNGGLRPDEQYGCAARLRHVLIKLSYLLLL